MSITRITYFSGANPDSLAKKRWLTKKAPALRERKTKQTNSEVFNSSLKTIAAFLNADGGTLLIGVSDSGGIKRPMALTNAELEAFCQVNGWISQSALESC